jgi:CBS-domain-containing membrane protein
MPRTIASLLQRDVPLLGCDEPVREAVRRVVAADLPALPVVDADERYAGIFGEREFITAIFPGYVKSLGYAAFVPKSAEDALEKRRACSTEPVAQHMNDEHIDVAPDFSDLQLAEIFIHHRVLVIPVVDDRRVCGLVTRADFFKALAERL